MKTNPSSQLHLKEMKHFSNWYFSNFLNIRILKNMPTQFVTIAPTADQLHKIITYDYEFQMDANHHGSELSQGDAYDTTPWS